MGSLYAKPCIATAWDEVGYQGDGYWNKYAEELDAVDFFNYHKNGECDWCAIFVCWCIYKNTLDADLEPCPSVWDAHYFLFEPDYGNAGAGCTQQAGYYKSHGAWYSSSQDAERGDQIFFTNNGGETYYHTGLVVAFGYVEELGTDGFTVIEGNTNGGQVAYKYYRYDDPKIGGFGRPRYDGWELSSDNEKEPEPQKEDDKPQPIPDPDTEFVTVELPVLEKGSTGGEVLTIQALLNGFEFTDDDGNEIAIDGIFGERTKQAVMSYQRERNLEVCGIVNYETWNRILK